jgi:hypothetical protein
VADYELRERVVAYLREQFNPYVGDEGWDFTEEEWRKVALDLIDMVRSRPRQSDFGGDPHVALGL